MADINRVILVGRLVRDAELKYTNTGTPVCNLTLAINKRTKNSATGMWDSEPHFFDVAAWGKIGESLSQYLKKSIVVGIEGELRQDRWEQQGQKRSRVVIVATNIQLLGNGKRVFSEDNPYAGKEDGYAL